MQVFFMKKLIVLLTVLTLLLCGCSTAAPAQTQPSGQTDADGAVPTETDSGNLFDRIADGVGELLSGEKKALTELGDGVRKESSFILYITINPEFEVFLDGNACITKIRCINGDANALFAELDVLGMSYNEGLSLILDAACEQDYLNEQNSEITIKTTVQEQVPKEYLEETMTELSAMFGEVVEQYAIDNGLSVTVDLSETEYDGPKVTLKDLSVKTGEPNSVITYDISLYDGVDSIATEYYDGNGVRYKRVVDSSDGSQIVDEYSSNGTTVYTLNLSADGYSYERFYDESGNLTKSAWEGTDGSRTEETYHANGNKAYRISKRSEGSCIKEQYNEDGMLLYYVHTSTDGYHTEEAYYENGQLKLSISDQPDGYWETHYNEDGTQSKSIVEFDGLHTVTTYYSNGERATEIANRSDQQWESRWDENGRLIYKYSNSGDVEYLFENYALTYYIDNGVEVTDREQLDMIAIAMGLYN